VIITIILIAVLITTGIIFYRISGNKSGSFNDEPHYEGISIGFDPYDEIPTDCLNIPHTSIYNITNETFKFQLDLSSSYGNDTIFLPFDIHMYSISFTDGTMKNYTELIPNKTSLYHGNNWIYYDNTSLNITFNFTISWLINSADPNLTAIKMFNGTNKISGTFYIDKDSWMTFIKLNTIDSSYYRIDGSGVTMRYGQRITIIPEIYRAPVP